MSPDTSSVMFVALALTFLTLIVPLKASDLLTVPATDSGVSWKNSIKAKVAVFASGEVVLIS